MGTTDSPFCVSIYSPLGGISIFHQILPVHIPEDSVYHHLIFSCISPLKITFQLLFCFIIAGRWFFLKLLSNLLAGLYYISFLFSAPGVVTITLEVVMISAPFAVAAPLNIFKLDYLSAIPCSCWL